MRTWLNEIFLTLLMLLAAGLACAAERPMSTARFEVVALNVSPSIISTGDELTVTAEVGNYGDLPGNFEEPLLLDGKQVDSRLITIQAGSVKSIIYKISPVEAGQHTLQLGSSKTSFTVKGSIEKEIELKYDNGKIRDALWAGYNGGFLTVFEPPVKPFAIKTVRICGGIYGTAWEGTNFELFILDKDMKSTVYEQQYAVAKFPVRGAFPFQPPLWVDFDVTQISFNDRFYVYLYTSANKHHGIHIGVDDSTVNEHSWLAQGKPPNIVTVEPTSQYPPTIWYSDISKLNWMIRVVGTGLFTQ